MNYKIETANYIECAIIPTNTPVSQGDHIYPSFRAAKKAYLNDLRTSREAWDYQVRLGRKLTKKEVHDNYHID